MHNIEAATSSACPDWGTPDDLFDRLRCELRLQLDVAAAPGNAMLPDYLARPDPVSGLYRRWEQLADAGERDEARIARRAYLEAQREHLRGVRWGGRAWLNPPYGDELPLWADKVVREIEARRSDLVCLLVPARTDTEWWMSLMRIAAEVRFIKGRLKFRRPGIKPQSALFPSAVILASGSERCRYSWISTAGLPILSR